MTADERSRLDAAVVREAAERPDSTVGVLVRTTGPVGPEERAALESAGLTIGTVAGTIVTGRLPAGAAVRVAQLPFVAYIELARRIPIPRPPAVRLDTATEPDRTRDRPPE